jgi:hypothetical protein
VSTESQKKQGCGYMRFGIFQLLSTFMQEYRVGGTTKISKSQKVLFGSKCPDSPISLQSQDIAVFDSFYSVA